MTYELELTDTERSEIAMGMTGRWELFPTQQEGSVWAYIDQGKLHMNEPSTGKSWFAPVPTRFNRHEREGGYVYLPEYFIPTLPSRTWGMVEIDFAKMTMEKAIELLTR